MGKSNSKESYKTGNASPQSMKYLSLLVYGYCRQIESVLSNLLPSTICQLCLNYISTDIMSQQLYHITLTPYNASQKNEFYLQINKNKPAILCHILCMDKKHKFQEHDSIFTPLNRHRIVVQTNAKLSNKLDQKICKLYNEYYKSNYITDYKYKPNRYNIVWMIDQFSGWIYKNIIHNYELHNIHNHNKIIGFLSCHQNKKVTTIGYGSVCSISEKHGLVIVNHKEVYTKYINYIGIYPMNSISDSNIFNVKKAVQLLLKTETTSFEHVMIGDNKLLAIGGPYLRVPASASQKVELIDLENHNTSWMSDCNLGRTTCSAFYDYNNNKVYVGGGNSSRIVEYWDVIIVKNKWFMDLPVTKYKHMHWPMLWKDMNENVLYIKSNESDDVEFIDCRVNNKQWNS
eukprot:10841_1